MWSKSNILRNADVHGGGMQQFYCYNIVLVWQGYLFGSFPYLVTVRYLTVIFSVSGSGFVEVNMRLKLLCFDFILNELLWNAVIMLSA